LLLVLHICCVLRVRDWLSTPPKSLRCRSALLLLLLLWLLKALNR
jgi:hypothetical protein